MIFLRGHAQDVQLSQFYAAQTLLNPGYTGAAHAARIMGHQRLQWPRMDAKFITSMVSFDNFSSQYRSGYGIIVMQDFQGGNDISSTEVHLQYAYELPISKTLTVRPGLQIGAASRNLNYADLTFPQQYDDFGFTGRAHDYGRFGRERKLYPDVGAGCVFYTDDLWVAVSGHHLNLPNQSFTGSVARLPVKMSYAAGYKIHLKTRPHMSYLNVKEEFSITPVIHYKHQGKADQVDIGSYVIYEQLMAGLWYRGIPNKRFQRLHNHESLIVLLGWQLNGLSISYSYDYTMSTLRRAMTGGAHEINITYIQQSKKKKPMKRLPCPTFYRQGI